MQWMSRVSLVIKQTAMFEVSDIIRNPVPSQQDSPPCPPRSPPLLFPILTVIGLLMRRNMGRCPRTSRLRVSSPAGSLGWSSSRTLDCDICQTLRSCLYSVLDMDDFSHHKPKASRKGGIGPLAIGFCTTLYLKVKMRMKRYHRPACWLTAWNASWDLSPD